MDYVLTFPTTFAVLQAEKQFKANEVEHHLRPTPRGLPSKCGLSISLPEGQQTKAVEILEAHGLDYSHLSKKMSEGFEVIHDGSKPDHE